MKVIVRALSDAGRKALMVHKAEEDLMREKIRRIPKFMWPKQTVRFMRLKSTFTDSEHIMEGADYGTQEVKDHFLADVKNAMRLNGAGDEDYEVVFDE